MAAAAKRCFGGEESVSKPCSILGPSIHASMSRRCPGRARGLPLGKEPVGTREVTAVTPRSLLKIILMLRLCLPEVPDQLDLCDNLALPKAGRIHVGYGFFGDALLLVVDIVDR